MPRVCILLGLCLAAFLAAADGASADDNATAALPAAATRKVDFANDIQPLLRKNCYSCHGAEAEESGLRLDLKQRAMEGGDGGRVIVAGDSAKSRLIHVVAGIDEDYGLMPPEGEGTPLTSDQIALLRAWIDQGVDWPASADGDLAASDHWSFQPLLRPAVPDVRNMAWVRNPLDAFVLARLENKGIEPSPPASREMLLRRLYLDLLGLPPSPEQLAEFLEDSRDDAYERLVERVLESDHYGERWGRHWLDLARYADSDGYEKDRPRPFAWRYRQWVIEALNADMPFDEFTVRQIAGDMLPEAGLAARVASGFHRNTLHNTEGGTDPEEDRVKKTVDRTNTVGTVWLGLTVGCAQCHSHKYDPLTQREYYSLYAFFNSMNETDIAAPLIEEQKKYEAAQAAFEKEQKKLADAIAEYEKSQLPAAQAAWEAKAAKSTTVWSPLRIANATSKHGADLKQQQDGSWLVSGKNVVSDVYTLEASVDASVITAIRLEVLPDKSLAKNGPGRAENGNFVLTTFKAELLGETGSHEIKFNSAQADFSQTDWEVAKAINEDAQDGWAVSPQFGKRHVAMFIPESPIRIEQDARLRVLLDQSYNQSQPHNIGRFRLSFTTSPLPVDLDGTPAAVAAALDTPAAKRSTAEAAVLGEYFRSIDPSLAKLKQAAADHAAKAPKLAGTKAQAVTELSQPRSTRVHIRGDFLNKGEPVAIRTPSVLPPVVPRNERPDRLDLARWLVSSENPLTARVTVNRIWQRYFGRGIVATVDDFGTQGELPSHPKLLDWLACELRENGWSLKHIHRLIVTSAVYRQSSAARPELTEIDPDNVLLARQNRRRVEAEIVRDLALAVSGLLDRTIGGPSVRPPQPSEYSNLTYANSARWQTSDGGDRYRRGLYTFFQRTSPYPMLMTFDAPDSTECAAARSESNTPLQALTLWNDVVFFECAQHLGRRILKETATTKGVTEGVTADATASDAERIDYAFQLCLGRSPSAAEQAAVAELLHQQTALLKQNEKGIPAITGPQPIPEGTMPIDVAAWTIIGRTLMNLDEFVTKE